MEVCEVIGMHSWTRRSSQTSQGCRNLVPAPSHTTSGETSVRALWTVAERASITRICLAKSLLNLGQAPTSQHQDFVYGFNIYLHGWDNSYTQILTFKTIIKGSQTFYDSQTCQKMIVNPTCKRGQRAVRKLMK